MAKNKSRLGRGLSSLLGVDDEAVEDVADGTTDATPSPAGKATTASLASELARAENGLFHVELSAVSVNPHQPRRHFEEVALRQLADSLSTSGLIQPIVVRPVPGGFELVAGERRFRAAKLAGLDRLPAVVRETDDVQQAELALVENIHRQDLNPIERAAAYRSLITHLGITQEELARRLHEERSSVANYLRLLELTGPVRDLVANEKLSMGHAKLLAGVHDVLEQRRLADLAVAEQLSVRSLERILQSAPPTRAARAAVTAATPHIADLEKRLSRDLQMRCQVRPTGSKGRGRLVIQYGSLDQFDQLLGLLGVRTED